MEELCHSSHMETRQINVFPSKLQNIDICRENIQYLQSFAKKNRKKKEKKIVVHD